MARVTDAEVKAVIDTARDTTPFITTATLIVDEELAGGSLSADRLTQIELYLAAHFCCLVEERGGIQRTEQGESVDAYQRRDLPENLGFAATRYGEQAIVLDTSGRLSAISLANRSLPALFSVVSEVDPTYS